MTKLEPGILHQGNYLTLELLPNRNLMISANEAGLEEAKEGLNDPEHAFWVTLMDDVLCNSEFETINPTEINALTDATILGWQVPRDDIGVILPDANFHVWTNIDYYQMYSDVEVLIRDGYTIFTKGNNE